MTVDNSILAAHLKAMLMTTIQVAIGGAIGAALRFLVGVGLLRMYSPGFPISVLLVNVLGSFLMGFFVVTFIQRGGEMLNPFFVTGLLGGFTTFSAFSLEAVNLFEQGAVSQSIAYIFMSVVFSIAGLIFGSMLARVIWL